MRASIKLRVVLPMQIMIRALNRDRFGQKIAIKASKNLTKTQQMTISP
jgi:hypothetical protein